MNRIYKVIWNRVKNCYVVVSEIANNRGKINGRSTTCVGTLLCILALVGGTLLPLNTANAVNPAGTGAGVSWGNGTNSGTDQNNVAIGGYAQALGPVSLALGAHSNSSASYSTAIGGGTQSTAENATAIGGVAKAQGKNATSIGAKAEANGEYATTIGAGAKADKTYAIAIGSLSHATEVSSLAMGNNSKATNTYAYAIGGSAEAKGRWSIAMGTNAVAEDDASVSIGTWSKATTGQSVAVGYLANAKQLGATALGRQTNASAVDATAIGSGSSSTAENGTAIGKSASVSAKDSVAIGTGAKATNENAVALGTGSETAATVATASESVNGVVHNFAGINPGSTVSVGKTGMERTVTNVAAGRISATSTDAINGSQLYAVTTEVNKGTVYAGDVKGTGATDNKFIQRLGAQTNIVGGVADTSKLSDNNIGVISNGTDTLNVKLAKELKDLTSVTAGDTVMNTDGVTITGGPKIVKTGIDAGNKQIVNVASGGDVTTNGANIGDINRIITAKDKYVTGGAATYQANGEGAANLIGTNGLTANVSGLKNNYVTSGSISNDGKVLTLERNDTGKVNVDLSNIFTEVAKGDYRLVENPEAGSQGKYKVDSNGNMVLTVANDKGDKKQVTLTDIASKAQQDNNTSSITTINTTLDKGLNFAGDTGAVSNRKLGDTVTVKGGATGALSDGNIGVESDGNGTLNVKLAKTLTGLDSVTAGNTSINNGGLTVGGKTYVSSTGLNANDQKITNVSDGTVGAGSKDAVNGGQLHDAKNELNNNITNAKTDLINMGLKFDANVGGVKTNKLGSTVTIQGEGTAADADYSGENLKTFINQDAATGNTTIDVKMNKNLKAESVKVGKNGKDGVAITGPDTANGTDGKVAVTDKNGKEAVSISGKDGVGHIGLTGPAGTNGVNGTNGIDLSVKPGYDDPMTGVKGEKGVDGTNGLTRIVYKDGNGEHQVATMEDGLQFTGNNIGTVNKQKLNSLVKVQGEGVTEAESAAFKSASGNINVKADGTDKLELQLAKDLKNLDSVTAAKTVKAGDATMGSQTVNNAAGDSETGNYVTGLDNKDWDANKIVSGRAATEDQLKKALDAQSANSTDYRLIKNQAAGSNGDYTVDANGDVALTVQDKNHPDKTETVTIKDVASKSKLDKLNDRAVKYDLDPAGNLDKSKVTYEGPAYNNKQGGTHVTNVAYATGNDGSEAVNVDYLNDKIKDSADALTNKGLKFDANQGGEKTNKLGSKVTIKGEGTAADEDYSGENLKTFITQDQTSGDTTINVKMNKNLKAESVKVGKDGKNGVSITGPDNGTDGKVAVTGKDGKEAVSISGKDGVGHIGLNGKDGHSADISVEKGDPDLNGNEITRIKYTDEKGKTHQVATKDDGMAYGGDNGDVIKKKLNEQLDIKGGVTNEADLTENNIGVISKNNILNVRLAKDLKDLNSITFNNGANGANGKTVVNGEGMTINDAAGNPLTAVTKDGVKITDGPSMTKDGIDAAGNKITNVQDGNVAKDSKDAVNGGQLHDAVESLKSKGFGLEAEDGQSVKKALGETVKVKGDDTNIKTSVDDGAVKVELKKDITVDTVTATTVTTGDTKMDTNGVTIKDGANEATKLTKDGLQINDGGNKAVTINKDGLTIENGPKVTKDGIDAADKKITNVADGTIGAGSKDAVNGGQLHTAIEDIKSTGFGLKAEDGNSVKKPLGETIDLKGDGNIKTSVDNGAIKMALNDKITLGQDPAKQVKIDGSEGTVTAGNGDKEVKLDGSAGTITAGKGDNQVKIDGNNGSVTANTVKAGDVVVGKQTSDGKEGNFVTGLDNKTWDPENPVAVPGRAATEDQLKAVNDDFNNKARTGRVFQGDQLGDSGKVVRGLGDTMNLTGGADVNHLADNNIGVVKNAAGDGYNIKLAKDLKGLESVTTTDAAGNTTVMNGGGMTITPAQGNAVSLTKDGLNNGGNRITNVGPGVDGTDAVNVNQLSSAMRSVDGKIADVGATSAAISGLKPLQYDPLEPTQVLAAVGHYKGSTAAAVGVAHYTNESTMFHMGVSLGGHDNMINAGVSYKFGTSDAKKAVPARYKAGPISSAYVLQDEVTALKAENERMKQHDLELTAKYDQVQRDNEEMKAQIALLMQQAGLTK